MRNKKKERQLNKEKLEEIKLVPENETVGEMRGFGGDELKTGSDDDDEEPNIGKLVREKNKKKKSGGFQSMGLSFPVFKGVMKKGYKVPTPIQRKCIPLILEGRDVVAMARTGSGKTAAFLIPMFEKLKTHAAGGARAMILSPTRELALQTSRFTRELAKFVELKFVTILGGDSMEEQFAVLHENPDIIIATPGRFLHILVEMNLKLSNVEYIVFDEADRLFEMGFSDQLQEIMKRLPDSRQTLLFSATLPQILVDFAQAGLTDPELIRLDVDTKLSENLQTSFFCCRADDKPAALLHILRFVVEPQSMTVIFAATKHHVEFLKELLTTAGIPCTYIYSSLDQTARKIHAARFQMRRTTVLIVTDVAARGIDIPMLDYVINYNFPAKPKLFVHRVGRVARAGRMGTAYSLVSNDELAFLCDLHLFLSRPLKFATRNNTKTDDGLIGTIPGHVIAEEEESINTYFETNYDLETSLPVIANAYKHYYKSCPAPSTESIKRMKSVNISQLQPHPQLLTGNISAQFAKDDFISGIRNYKPQTTIFEIGSSNKSEAYTVMKNKRKKDGGFIAKRKTRDELDRGESNPSISKEDTSTDVTSVDDKFTVSVKDGSSKSNDFYLPYRPVNFHLEKGLEVDKKGFTHQAKNAIIEMTMDEPDELKKQQHFKQWDRKKKKYVGSGGPESVKKRKIMTESGTMIPASFKSNIYEQWLKRSKVDSSLDTDDHQHTTSIITNFKKFRPRRFMQKKYPGSSGGSQGGHAGTFGLKPKEQIVKNMKAKSDLIHRQKKRTQTNEMIRKRSVVKQKIKHRKR